MEYDRPGALRRVFEALVALTGVFLSAGITSHAWAGGCAGEPPLLEVEIPPVNGQNLPGVLGEWRLPISGDAPETLTEARVRLVVESVEEGFDWKASVFFTFPDPKPLGIPFTFERAEISVPDLSMNPFMDWSSSCSGPGRGLYPGQSWADSLFLNSFSGYPAVLRIYGSRN